MDPNLTEDTSADHSPGHGDATDGAHGREPAPPHWSPLSTRGARLSWVLLTIFTVIYFVVAVLTSAEFAGFAAVMILGLPLGFILGIGLIIAGLIITRLYLTRVEG